MDIERVLPDTNMIDVHLSLPGKYDVCWQCEGLGKIVDPAIDGNGISPQDFADDPEFERAYFGGNFDVKCDVCNGNRVTPEIDVSRCTFDQKRHIVRKRIQNKDIEEMEATYAAERAMGA